MGSSDDLQGCDDNGRSAGGGDVGGGSYSYAYYEPKGIAAEVSPEGPSLGGVTLVGEGVELGEIVGVVLLGDG